LPSAPVQLALEKMKNIFYFFNWIRLFTLRTPLVEPAICPALVLSFSVSTAPVKVTIPSKVATEIAKPLRMDSSRSFAFTLVVIAASSTTSPAVLPAGVVQAVRTKKTPKHMTNTRDFCIRFIFPPSLKSDLKDPNGLGALFSCTEIALNDRALPMLF
jgi:hypothetical protein